MIAEAPVHVSGPRSLPRNVEAEEGVLASCVLDHSGAEVMSLCLEAQITHETFTELRHQVLWSVLKAMSDEQQIIDETSIIDRLRSSTVEHIPWLKAKSKQTRNPPLESTLLEVVGGIPAFLAITDRIETTAHASHWLASIVEKWNFRRLIELANRTLNEAYGASTPSTDLVANLEADLLGFSTGENTTTVRPAEVFIQDAFDRMDEVRNAGGNNQILGFRTGLLDLDMKIGGLQRDRTYIIAARPGMGKSALANTITIELARQAVPTLVFSLEMPAEEYGQRMICAHARTRYQRYIEALCTQTELNRVYQSRDWLKQRPVWVDDMGDNEILRMRATARRYFNQHAGPNGEFCVIIDYLQLVEGPPSKIREQEISAISRHAKLMSRELHCPVLVLSQLNREAEKRENPMPRPSDLRESGAIEQDADVIIFIAPTEKDEVNNKWVAGGKMLLGVAKQRGGPTGEVPVTFIGEITRFENYASPNV
jgi:replicative DNA helicase